MVALSAENKRNIRIAIIAVFTIALLVAVPLSAILNTRSNTSRKSGGVDNYDLQPYGNGLAVDVNVTNFSPTLGAAGFHMIVYQVENDETVTRNGSLQLIANSKTTNFSRFELIPQIDVAYTAISSSSNNYPFDEYTVQGTFMLIPSSGPAPVSVYLSGVIDAWDPTYDIEGGSTASPEVIMTLVFKRSVLIKFFAIFIALLMWLLAISILVMASTIWIRGRKIEPPTIAVAGALLFALPVMRNNLPAAPPVGITFDLASFFWCMFLVSVSLLLMIWNYIVMTKEEKAKLEKKNDGDLTMTTIVS